MVRNTDIDKLRAVAIILAIFSHIKDLWLWETPISLYMPFDSGLIGSIGVFIFFVISGYVISLTLMEPLDKARLSGDPGAIKNVIKSFFVKRLFRITPSCILWVVISFIFLRIFYPELSSGNFFASIAAILNFSNIFQALPDHPANSLGFYWSLSLEEQFYIIFPFFLLLVNKNYLRIIILSIMFTIILNSNEIVKSAFQIYGIVSGILLYIIGERMSLLDYLRKKCNNEVYLKVLSYIMIIGCVFFIPYVRIRLGDIGFIPQSIYVVLMVGIACINKNVIFSSKVIHNIMHWIGSRSFAIYISHYPIILTVRAVIINYGEKINFSYSSNNGTTIFIAWMITNILVVEASYKLFENRLTKVGRDISKKLTKNQ